jgi:hypothetical protein
MSVRARWLVLAVLLCPAAKSSAAPVPNREKAEVGTCELAEKMACGLLTRREDGWKRLAAGDRVISTEPLVCLPGCGAEVRTPGGAALLLRSNLPQFSLHPIMDYLLDSAVTLHQNKDFDLDFTFERGRVYVSSRKAAGLLKVRVRFWDEVWDLTLEEPGTEVGLDLLTHYTRDINFRAGEEPRAELYLCMIAGKASLRVGSFDYKGLKAPPGPAVFVWDNMGRPSPGPQRLEMLPAIWGKQPPNTEGAKDMALALEELSKQVPGGKGVECILVDALGSERLSHRLLAVYSLCAIDEVRKLLDVLADENPAHFVERDTAIYCLRRWLSRSAGNHMLFYDSAKKRGILIDKEYRPAEADLLMDLLHDFNEVDVRKAETFDLLIGKLASDRIAIRELAWWHLLHLTTGMKDAPAFNAAWPAERRAAAIKDWRKLLDDGKLPPPPPMKPAVTNPPGKD